MARSILPTARLCRYAGSPGTGNITGMRNGWQDRPIALESGANDMTRQKLLQQVDSTLTAENHYALGWYDSSERIAYWSRFGHPEWYLGKSTDWRGILSNWWYDPELAAKVECGEAMEVGVVDVDFWGKLDAR